MFIDVDYNKKMKDYKIELSKPNKTIITNLSERIDAKLSVGLGSIGELTFKIPYKIENDYHEIIDNPNIDLLREKMYLRLTIGNQKMWFIVDNISDQTEDLDMMNVQAFSLPIELKNKKISELNLTSVNADMLMDELLISSSWSKGTVDLELQSTYRTFDFSETTIYDALVNSAETFGAIIVWDEENKTISFRELTNISQYKGMSVNAEKFLNSLKRTRDTDEMVTRLYVYGNEKMSIQNVNPSGLRYIEDFSYFLEPFTRDANKNVLTHSNYMSDELCHAILDNKELKELALPQINTLQSEVIVLNSNLALKDIELTELKLSLSTTKGLLDIAKSTGDTALIAQRQSEVINFETLVSTKTSEIGTIISQINTKTNEMTALQDSVSITSFTPELLDELDVYIVEKDFYDDRYIDETELYNAGINKFAEIRSPKIVVEISIDNLLNVVEEQYYWDKIVLGDMIQVKYPNMKINYKSTIVGLDFDLDEMDCSVKIANHTDNLDSIDKLVSIIYENQSTSLTISNNKYKWDSIIDVRDRVDQLRDGEIDAVKNRIKAGVNESVNIGDNGIVLTNPNFPEEMVIMQAGVIALTRDGGETWNTSITPRGVIAETIIGNLIAGNELVITNSSGTFVMDASGLTIDADNIFINSGDTQTPENLVEYWNSMSLTMAEFSNDNVINKYEKQQIKKQWDNIVSVHNSMIDKFYAEIGTETAENPYPVEYDIYMAKYEALNTYLNTTLQSDGFSILNALNADNTTTINPLVYNTKFSEFSKAKDDFQIVIPMEYTKASISVLESGINLNYVKNNNVVAMINLSEEGVRIDGKLLTIDAETHFNNDLVMNAGVIKSADGGTVLDLNNNTFTFDKPFTIGVSNVATVEDVENIEIGGRNLWLKSSAKDSFSAWNVGSGTKTLDSTALLNGEQTIKFVRDGASEGGMYNYAASKLEANTTITYSFMVKSSVSVPVHSGSLAHIQVIGTSDWSNGHREQNMKYSPSSVPANKWTKVSVTFNTPIEAVAGETFKFRSFLWYLPSNAELYFGEFKLEKGNKATDWTPAPEDVEKAYTDLAIAKANLAETTAKAHADGIVTAEEQARIAEASAKLAEAKTYADTKVNNIEIGGRNYALDTKSVFLSTNTNASTGYQMSNDFKKDARGKYVTVSAYMSGSFVAGASPHYGIDVRIRFTDATTVWIVLNRVDFSDIQSGTIVGKRNYQTDLIPDKEIQSVDSLAYFIRGMTTVTSYVLKDVMIEIGNKPSGWTVAPEDVAYDIEQKADSKAVSDAINDVSSSVSGAQAIANAKLDKSSYDNFINEYIDYKKAIASEQSDSSKSLQDARDSITGLTNNMGDMKESWKFNNGTQIDATGDGMLLSDGTGGMNLLLSNNRISFFDSGVEVAYIADKTLKINHGIFVKSAQIGAHLISSFPSNPDITIVSWVGI